jgi:hypothetical protein
MHRVTALAAIGNEAAHSASSVRKQDVERLMNGVADFSKIDRSKRTIIL